MSLEINMLKLLKQDDDFREFVKDSLLGMVTANTKDANALLSSIHNLYNYNIGMTREEVQTFFRNNAIYISEKNNDEKE